jgi:hypothetical protein
MATVMGSWRSSMLVVLRYCGLATAALPMQMTLFKFGRAQVVAEATPGTYNAAAGARATHLD